MRKKIVLIGLVATFILLGVLCYKTWLIAFFITRLLSGGTEGKQGIVRSIIIPWRDYRFHLHHWFLALVAGGAFLVKGFYVLSPEMFYGFLSAVIFQGVYCYGDWHRIIRRKAALPALEPPVPVTAGVEPELSPIHT